MTMTMLSSAFLNGQQIPVRHTGEGQDISPELSWLHVPQSAQELALICDDPDAPTPEPWVHWVIYNLPAQATSLPEQIPRDRQLTSPIIGFQGRNSWQDDNIGYLGPMPPRGHGVHHYHFKLFALAKPLNLPAGLNKDELLESMTGHIIATASIVGTYERK